MNLFSLLQGVIVVLTTTISPAPTQPPSLPITSSPPVQIIHAQDTIDYMNQKTIYYIDFPKNGGSVTGKMTGLCNGNINGDFDGQSMKGTISGTCTAGFIPVPSSAKFTGEVSSSNRRVNLTVDAETPVQGRHSLSLPME